MAYILYLHREWSRENEKFFGLRNGRTRKEKIRLWESIEMAFVNGRATTTTKYTFIH